MVFFSAMKNNEIIAEKPFPNTSAVPKGGRRGRWCPLGGRLGSLTKNEH